MVINDVFAFITPMSVFRVPEQYSISERSKAELLKNTSYRRCATRERCILLVIRGCVMITPSVSIV